MADTFGYGYAGVAEGASEHARQQYMVQQILARVRTALLVKVMGVAGGGVNPPGTVNVQPLVSMVDGAGNATEHGTIFGVPVLRFQSGNGAIIVDPQAGDIGLMLVCDRDISAAKSAGDVGPPGSGRRFDLADGVYLGGILGATPTRFIHFDASGITIEDDGGNKVELSATGLPGFSIKMTDANGNNVRMSVIGITMADNNANQIQMRTGFVNIVTPVLQVNGVPVTVP